MTDDEFETPPFLDAEAHDVLDVWEHAGHVCLVSCITLTRPEDVPPEARETLPCGPRHYTGYVETVLDYEDVSGDRGYPHRLDVHGGVTYGPNDGWVGFDTAHAYDVNVDADGERLPGDSNPRSEVHGREWDPEAVRAEAERLAENVAALERELGIAP